MKTSYPLLAAFTLAAANVPALGAASDVIRAADPQSTQSPEGERREAGTRLILLGTAGGPIVRADRSEPANLLIVNGTPYLIDAGDGTQRQLKRAGYRPVDLAAIFITHHHLDHNANVGTLISSNWIEGRATPLPVIGPYGTVDLVKAGLDYFSASERIFSHGGSRTDRPAASALVAARDITGPGVIYQDKNIRVTAVINSHYSTFDPGADQSFSYRFDTADRSVVFTGDTGPSKDLVALAKDADVLVSEVIDVDTTIPAAFADVGRPVVLNSTIGDHMRLEHLSPTEVGKLAKAANVKMVVLTHLAPGLDSERNMTLYSAGVREEYSGPVLVGKDLSEF